MTKGFLRYAAVVSILALAVASLFLFLVEKGPVQVPGKVSTADSSLGISFALEVNSTVFHSGQGVNITAYVTNDRLSFNNITAAQNWAQPWLVGWSNIGGCYSFVNAQIFRGYYGAPNLSAILKQISSTGYGLRLVKSQSPSCPAHMGQWFTFFPFQPDESRVGYCFTSRATIRQTLRCLIPPSSSQASIRLSQETNGGTLFWSISESFPKGPAVASDPCQNHEFRIFF